MPETPYTLTPEEAAVQAAKQLAAAEAAAPLDTSGPLPRVVATLKSIPHERRHHYKKMMDDSFQLAYIWRGDTASIGAYNHEIATGKLRVLADGDTPARIKEREERGVRMAADVMKRVNDRAAKEKADRLEAARQAALKKVNQQFGR